MNSENKTEKCDKWCEGCEEWTDKLNDHPSICMECDAIYENKTGYCSLSCCLTGICDESC